MLLQWDKSCILLWVTLDMRIVTWKIYCWMFNASSLYDVIINRKNACTTLYPTELMLLQIQISTSMGKSNTFLARYRDAETCRKSSVPSKPSLLAKKIWRPFQYRDAVFPVHRSHCWDDVIQTSIWVLKSGSWFNIKMSSYQYRKSHCGDKTAVRSSYLHNGISYTGKRAYFLFNQPPESSMSTGTSQCQQRTYIMQQCTPMGCSQGLSLVPALLHRWVHGPHLAWGY